MAISLKMPFYDLQYRDLLVTDQPVFIFLSEERLTECHSYVQLMQVRQAQGFHPLIRGVRVPEIGCSDITT